jgi:hypothetical protein
MMNSFTVWGNGKDRARNVKNEQQRDIFVQGNLSFPMKNALDDASHQWRRPGNELTTYKRNER